MAKFKVGDRVRIGESTGNGHNEYVGLKGVVLEVTSGVFQYEVKVGNGAHACYREDELTLIKPKAPKPKSIPARNLSGKHIGRVVTVTSASGRFRVTSEVIEVVQRATETVVLMRNDDFGNHPHVYVHADPDSKVVLS